MHKVKPSLRHLFLAGIALPAFCALAPAMAAGRPAETLSGSSSADFQLP
jgi:hypothetical protein